jgi:translation initiation factor IF-3
LQKKPFQRNNRFDKKEDEHRINEKITNSQIRLVCVNIEPGIYYTDKALEMAYQQELDLVEISPNVDPPVCKIMDYKKFLYEKKKRDKEIKAKAVKTVIKEIRFSSNTDEHDLDFKAKHAEKFLNDGDKVKCYVMFRGRDIVFKDRGNLLLLNFAKRLEDVASVEAMPKLEGRRMFMTLIPKGKKNCGWKVV